MRKTPCQSPLPIDHPLTTPLKYHLKSFPDVHTTHQSFIDIGRLNGMEVHKGQKIKETRIHLYNYCEHYYEDLQSRWPLKTPFSLVFSTENYEYVHISILYRVSYSSLAIF